LCSRISKPAAPTKNVFEAVLKLEQTRTGVPQHYDNFIRYTIQLASRATLFFGKFTLWLILTFLTIMKHLPKLLHVEREVRIKILVNGD
jgi:hypothetical protein